MNSNKNFYLDNSKRYYIQLTNTIISLLANNVDKNITIKILNLNNSENNVNNNNKFFYELDKLPVTIGRINCNININKNYISKNHLTINYDNKLNQFYVRDNGSTNGSVILLKKGKDIKLEDKMFFFWAKVLFTQRR